MSTYVVAVTSVEFNFVYGPPLTVDLYMLLPDTVEVLAVQVSVTECDTVCTPVPDSATDTVELLAVLVTVTLPGVRPVPAGANVTFSVADWPGPTICPDCIPVAEYPAPDMLTFEIVMLEFPPFVKATGRTLLLPIFTFEKFKLV